MGDFYNSKYYTCEEIDKRLLQGTYDDAVKAGFKGTKEEFDEALVNINKVALKEETDKKFSELDKKFNELNISALCPTNGVDGGNTYTLATAITQVPVEYRTILGLKITFISNVTTKPETWVYNSGTFTDVNNWSRSNDSEKLNLLSHEIKNVEDEIFPLSGLTSNNLVKIPKFGKAIQCDNFVNNLKFSLFTSYTPPYIGGGNNLAYIKDGNYSSEEEGRFTVNVEGGIIKLSGSCTTTGTRDLNASITLNKGRYYIQAQLDTSKVESGNVYMKTSYNYMDLTNKGEIISLDESTKLSFYTYTNKWPSATQIDITDVLEIKLLVMRLEDEENVQYPQEWSPAVNTTLEINFATKDGCKLQINENSIELPIQEYPLFAVKVDPTKDGDTSGKMKRIEDFATYANTEGDCYVSDSYEFINGKLSYVKRVGIIDSYSADIHKALIEATKMPNGKYQYLSDNIDGLVEGCKVYYALPKEEYIETEINDILIEKKNIISLSTDKDGTYFYAEYDSIKKYKVDNLSSITRMSNLDNVSRYCGANLIDGKYAYSGSAYGELSKIDISNVYYPEVVKKITIKGYTLYNVGWIRSICADDNYIYVISRQLSAGSTSEDVRGVLSIVDKNTFEEVAHIKLINKGTGGEIYEGNIYVMEQMYDWAVYSLSEIKRLIDEGSRDLLELAPLFQLDLGESQNSLGEYQNIAFWENNSKKYCAITSFDKGIHFFDITNVNDGGKYCVKRLSGIFPRFRKSDDIGPMQIFDVVSDFPNIYFTISVSKQETRFSKTAYRGIVRLDVSDINVFYVETDNDKPDEYGSVGVTDFGKLIDSGHSDIFSIGEIPYEDWSDHYNEGDPHPSRIVKIGDICVTNNGSKGMAVFRCVGNELQFQNTHLVGGEFQAISSDSNKVAVSTENSIFSIYTISNVNFVE